MLRKYTHAEAPVKIEPKEVVAKVKEKVAKGNTEQEAYEQMELIPEEE